MRAAELLLLLLLLLLGVSSQDDSGTATSTGTATTTGTTTPTGAATPTETTTTTGTVTTTETTTTTGTTTTTETTTTTGTTTATGTTMTTGTTTMTTTASTTETSTTTAAPPSTALTTTTAMTEKGTPQPPVGPPITADATATITTTALAPSMTMSPTTTVTGTTPTSTATTIPSLSGQGSSTHRATTTPAASSTTPQQLSDGTATSGSSGTTAAAKTVVTDATSPPGAVGAAGTFPPTTQPQGNQSLGHLPKTTVRTDPSQSSKDCVVPPPRCPTKKPLSSSSPAAQAPTLSTSSGSTGTSVSTPIGTTPMSQSGSKKAATTTAPGTDQSTHDVGPAPGKPSSASQSPDSAQPPEQAESCGSGHQQPNISNQNELICKDHVQHARPTIQLKEPRTCEDWETAHNNISFFESFCSTAQHVFNASRDRCTVTLMACQPLSRHWAVWVVLHYPLDSEEVLKELKEKKDKLEELGIVNITSDKMVEDMTINDEFSTPLIITIITLAGSLLLIATIYGCHQRFSQKKDQRLTEEMQTMENGYHDNPTLEVMETSSEMQEKKVNLNGELGDSWIVPLDTLMKEDLEEEEDTHL